MSGEIISLGLAGLGLCGLAVYLLRQPKIEYVIVLENRFTWDGNLVEKLDNGEKVLHWDYSHIPESDTGTRTIDIMV